MLGLQVMAASVRLRTARKEVQAPAADQGRAQGTQGAVMVDWVQQPIPGTLEELATVAILDGRRFAAIAEWKRSPQSRRQFMVVLDANRAAPSLFTTLHGAKRFVEAAAQVAARS